MFSIHNMKYTFNVSNLIDTRTKEFINALIVVMSRLDAVVASKNIKSMENHIQTYAVI